MSDETMSDDRTLDLIEEAKRGRKASFEELAERHRERLEAFIRRRLGSQLSRLVDAEDIVQETLGKAWRSLGRFTAHGEGAFLRWLEVIAEHAILATARKHRRAHEVSLDREPVSVSLSPSRAERRRERFGRLQDALQALSPDHRQVILWARIEGLPVHEIARRMGRSPNAVSLLLVRALRDLKRRFGETESLHLLQSSLEEERREGP